MKKFFAVVLSVFMVVSLAACGDAEFKNIKELSEAGFECTSYQYDDQKWAGLFRKGESMDAVYKVVAEITAAEQEALDSIDWEDEEGDNKRLAIYENFEKLTITNIADQIPSQDDLSKYVGKTFADLKADGYEPTGWIGEGSYDFFFDGKMASIKVSVDGADAIEDPDNAPDTLVIKSVEFMDLGNGILDD